MEEFLPPAVNCCVQWTPHPSNQAEGQTVRQDRVKKRKKKFDIHMSKLLEHLW